MAGEYYPVAPDPFETITEEATLRVCSDAWQSFYETPPERRVVDEEFLVRTFSQAIAEIVTDREAARKLEEIARLEAKFYAE